MKITKYEVIINEKNATCGFVVNLKHYAIEDFLKEKLNYEVNYKEKNVRVFNNNKEIMFENLTDQLLYYAIKTIDLTILGGVEGNLEENSQIKIVANATLT